MLFSSPSGLNQNHSWRWKDGFVLGGCQQYNRFLVNFGFAFLVVTHNKFVIIIVVAFEAFVGV